MNNPISLDSNGQPVVDTQTKNQQVTSPAQKCRRLTKPFASTQPAYSQVEDPVTKKSHMKLLDAKFIFLLEGATNPPTVITVMNDAVARQVIDILQQAIGEKNEIQNP